MCHYCVCFPRFSTAKQTAPLAFVRLGLTSTERLDSVHVSVTVWNNLMCLETGTVNNRAAWWQKVDTPLFIKITQTYTHTQTGGKKQTMKIKILATT